MEVFVRDKRILCEAEEVLLHTLGSEEATVGKLLATVDREIVLNFSYVDHELLYNNTLCTDNNASVLCLSTERISPLLGQLDLGFISVQQLWHADTQDVTMRSNESFWM